MNVKSILNTHNRRLLLAFIANTVLTLLLLTGCFRYSVLDSFHPASYQITDDLDSIYSNSSHYVDCDISTLYYSGYDYMRNNKISGHYYYALEDGKCTIFIISNNYIGNTDTPPDTLEDVQFEALVLKHDSNLKPLLSYIANDLDWNYDGIARVTSPYIVSMADYSHTANMVILVMALLSIISNVCLLVILIIKKNT